MKFLNAYLDSNIPLYFHLRLTHAPYASNYSKLIQMLGPFLGYILSQILIIIFSLKNNEAS